MFLSAFETPPTLNLLAAVVVAVSVTALYKWREAVALTSKNGIPLPPGPPARWFWESALPTVNVARRLTSLIDQYGPVIALRQGSQVVIVVGRADAAAEILEKEGASVADRPRSIAAGEIHGQNMRFVLLHAGDRLRRFRKAVHTHLQPKATIAYQSIQMEDARSVIIDILNHPMQYHAHVGRFAASVMLRLTYGKSTPTASNDPEVKKVYQANGNFRVSTHPGAFLVDRIPWLQYLPGYGRQLKEFREFEEELYHNQMGRVELGMRTNSDENSFMRTLLENAKEHGLSRDEIAYIGGDLFGAGTGTTSSVIIRMIMAAACYLEAQTRVQEQLDAVVGKERMPTFEDSESLTQVHAFVSEAFRWRPPTPFGFPHRATQDIIWRGQWIPAGATVLGCNWAICHDPATFPEPEQFNPQRWFDSSGQLRNDMSAYQYGFGRRACPGQYIANKSLYINLAFLLWAFRIVERPDAPIETSAFTDTVVSHAYPFKVEFVPRMDKERLKEMLSEL